MNIVSNNSKNTWALAAYVSTAFYIVAFLFKVFSGEFLVQDDARAHVLWAYKYFSPGYFNNDIMLEYFETMAPHGYRWLYQLVAWLGTPPFLFNKLLPIFLGIGTCYYAFRLADRIFESPCVAFVATLILNHMLWGQDNLTSGTPRAFIYPLLLASMVYMLNQALWPLALTLVLESIFYPHALFLSLITYGLTLFKFNGGQVSISKNRRDYLQALTIGGLCFLALLPYLFKSHDYGPLVNYKEAMNLPEFQKGGRSQFFFNNGFKYWLWSKRSGIWPSSMGIIANICLILSLAFPFLWNRRERFGLSLSTINVSILPRLVIASLLMFFLAHLVLFHLHLPSRFTQHSLRIVVAMMAAQVIVASTIYIWNNLQRQRLAGRFEKSGAYLLLSLYGVLLAYPLVLFGFGVNILDGANIKTGKQPGLYRFLVEQPRDSVIAVLSDTADYIPSFSLRSVVYAREYAIAYHRGYYTELERRRTEMEAAYMTDKSQLLKQFINNYKVSHFVIDGNVRNRWILQAASHPKPLLSKIAARCTVYRGDKAEVVDTSCLMTNI